MSRISSARRRPPPRGGTVLLAAGVVVLAILGVMVAGRRSPQSPAPAPTPTPSPAVVRVVPSPSPSPGPPTPTPTPTPRLVKVEGRAYIELPEMPPETPPTPTPETEPDTPRLTDCIAIESSSAHQSTAAWGQILVAVEITNHCGRDLGPLEVWLEVAGYKDGALVQAVMGHPFDELRDDDSTEVVMALPGSLDWYDRVDVNVVPQ